MSTSEGDFAEWLFNSMTHAELENLAGRSTFPMVDCERLYTYDVIEDFGVIEVHHESTDGTHALPVRLTYGANGFEIELADYNLGPRQIDVLRRALVAYYRLGVGRPQ